MDNLIKLKPYALILAIVFIMNIIFIITSQHYGFVRPYINIDYIILGVLAYKKHKFNSILLFIGVFVFCFIELLLLCSQIFPFIQLGDLVYFSTFLLRSPALYQFIIFGSVILLIVLFIIIRDVLYKKINLDFKQFMLVFGFYIVLLVVSISNLFPTLLRSQTLFFIQNNQANMLDLTHGKMISELESQALSQKLLDEIRHNQLKSKKILFVVNESWSETAKPEQQQAILKAIYAQKNHLEFIEQGSFFAMGATVTGEVRELCHKKLSIMDTKQIPKSEFTQCIPNLMKQKGYQTYSIYGADSNMYSPFYWYPLAGLDHRYFVDDLPEGGECKSFQGRCDVKLIPRVKQLLSASDKSFVYWLTLNSHAPYDDLLFIHGLECSSIGINNDSDVCGNYKLQYQFFTILSQLIQDPTMKGVEVYVVGDHPAPVANIKEGLKGFKGSDVAWLHFKIKE